MRFGVGVYTVHHGNTASFLPPGPGGGKPPQYWTVYDKAFSPEECERLIAAFNDLDSEQGGLVVGQFSAKIRNSALVWLPEDDDFAWAHNRITRLIADANRDVFQFALDGFEEQLQLAAYGPGHYYDWHIDRGQGAVAGRRKLTISVQVSAPDSYLGGELELNADGHPFTAPRDQGTAVVFAANTLHRVAPVISGLRHSLVAWVHGPNFV